MQGSVLHVANNIVMTETFITDILFVSAQPDQPHYVWQSHVYLHNFLAKGIQPQNCIALFSTEPDREPSRQLRDLQRHFPEVDIQIYPDTRDADGQQYAASIQPHLIAKAYEVHPDWNDRLMFFHDCDIVFRRLPHFDHMLRSHPECCLLSDTIPYIGYTYLHDCCEKIRKENPAIPPDHLLQCMCNVVGIDIDVIKDNEPCSGGAQYLLLDVDRQYWEKVYDDSVQLASLFRTYHRLYNLNKPTSDYIQSWTAGMWAYLWNLWWRGHRTVIHQEMDFHFSGESTNESKPILHMAGLQDRLKTTHFDKQAWIDRNPIDTLHVQPFLFDHIPVHTVAHEYVSNICEIVGIRPYRQPNLVPAKHWRVLAWHTESTFAWDVERCQFFTEKEEWQGIPLESGNAGAGYEVRNAWDANPTTYWGGRQHSNGHPMPYFFLGMTFDEAFIPGRVTISQREGPHRAERVLLQCSQNGTDWQTAIVTHVPPTLGPQTLLYHSAEVMLARQWRVWTTQTSTGCWDIQRLAFLHNHQEQAGTPFSSGCAFPDDLPMYGPQHAFEDTDGYWGGRPDAHGQFYVGITATGPISVNHLILEQQSPQHQASESEIQCSDDGVTWQTLKTVRNLRKGINHIFLFDSA